MQSFTSFSAGSTSCQLSYTHMYICVLFLIFYAFGNFLLFVFLRMHVRILTQIFYAFATSICALLFSKFFVQICSTTNIRAYINRYIHTCSLSDFYAFATSTCTVLVE
jgi:hypothetical protein